MIAPQMPEPSPDDYIVIGIGEGWSIPEGWTEGRGEGGQRFAWKFRGDANVPDA